MAIEKRDSQRRSEDERHYVRMMAGLEAIDMQSIDATHVCVLIHGYNKATACRVIEIPGLLLNDAELIYEVRLLGSADGIPSHSSELPPVSCGDVVFAPNSNRKLLIKPSGFQELTAESYRQWLNSTPLERERMAFDTEPVDMAYPRAAERVKFVREGDKLLIWVRIGNVSVIAICYNKDCKDRGLAGRVLFAPRGGLAACSAEQFESATGLLGATKALNSFEYYERNYFLE